MTQDETVKTSPDVPDQPPELRQALDDIEANPPAAQPSDDRDARPEGDSAAQRVTTPSGKEEVRTTHPGGIEQTGDGPSLMEDQGDGSS
jgi:hypothetical protein